MMLGMTDVCCEHLMCLYTDGLKQWQAREATMCAATMFGCVNL